MITSISLISTNQLATGSFDNKVRIWNLKDRSLIWEIRDHQRNVNQVAFLNATCFASASRDSKLILWDSFSFQILGSYSASYEIDFLNVFLDGLLIGKKFSNYLDYIYWPFSTRNQINFGCAIIFVDVIPSSSNIACACNDGLIKVLNSTLFTVNLNIALNKQIKSFKAINNTYLAYALSDRSVNILDIEKNKNIKSLNGLNNDISSLEVIDECTLAIGFTNGDIKIWDFNFNNNVIGTWAAHFSSVTTLKLLDSGF